jgi:hypothetical protein
LAVKALFAVMAQQVRSRLGRCLHYLIRLNNEGIGILARSSNELVRRLWNEVAVLEFGLV